MKEIFTAAFWRDVWWYLAHPGYLAYGYSPTGDATPGEPPKTWASNAPCSHSGIGVSTWFDRSVCPEPCSSMHDRCTRCGRAVGGCPLESVDDYEATTGHAITCGAGFGAGCQCEPAAPASCPECSEPYREVPGGRSCTHARDCQYAFRPKRKACRYCPDPLCPEDCPECGGAIHDLDAVPAPPLCDVVSVGGERCTRSAGHREHSFQVNDPVREAIRQARGDEAAPQVPVTFGPCGTPGQWDCPTCGPVTLEPHPRLPVMRCSNCKEHAGPRDDEGRPPCDHCGVVGHSFEDCPEGESHYGDNGSGISGQHTGRVEDCPGPGCGPRDCEASDVITLLGRQEAFGPCALREGHDGPMHRESGGRSWAALRDDTVSVPREALRGLVRVAEYVAGSEPYPDPVAARRALGALDDAGLLDQFREDGGG